MGMKASEIEAFIKEAFPDADIEINDLAGDDNHFAATVTPSPSRAKAGSPSTRWSMPRSRAIWAARCMRCSYRPSAKD